MQAQANIRPTDSPQAGLSTQDTELVARADQGLARAYEQIALADEQLARVNEQLSTLEKSEAPGKLRRASRDRPALRGLLALLLTMGICTAAFAWHLHGATVKPVLARWMPQLMDPPRLAADQAQPAVQLAAADPAPTALQNDAASPAPPDAVEQLQTLSRDLVSLQQEIEQLKAGQEALVRETAVHAEQIRQSREQASRALAMVSEQAAARPAAPPLPVANPVRRPAQVAAPTEARAQVRAPVRPIPRPQ